MSEIKNATLVARETMSQEELLDFFNSCEGEIETANRKSNLTNLVKDWYKGDDEFFIVPKQEYTPEQLEGYKSEAHRSKQMIINNLDRKGTNGKIYELYGKITYLLKNTPHGWMLRLERTEQ